MQLGIPAGAMQAQICMILEGPPGHDAADLSSQGLSSIT